MSQNSSEVVGKLETQTEIVGRPTMKYAIIMDTERIKEWREY